MTALLDGFLFPCLNSAIVIHVEGKKAGGGRQALASNPYVTNYYTVKLSSDSSGHKNPFHSNNKYMRIDAVITIDKQL